MKPLYLKLVFFVVIGFSFLNPIVINAQCVTGAEDDASHPKRDMRGVFIPTLFNISWPSSASDTPAVQQAELISILDDMEANGYNSFFLQVRPAGDAFYNSTIEPWSHWLTGTEGTAPSPLWDPLAFAITEAHARGIELHAWLNPYRVKYGSYTTAPDHVISENPSWTFIDASNSSRTILNPGLPAVSDYIVSVVEDIASRYDVDGIHFDDYFYPKNGMTAPPNNQDAQAFIDHNPGGLSLNDWRRDNVNNMIGMVYDAIQVINSNDNKNVVFGVSPFGIWKSGTPPGIVGSSSYNDLFCDPIAWMQAGKVDYLAPQLYWAFGGGQDYDILSQWWNDQCDTYNTQLYVSQSYYKMDSPWNWAASELQNQIDENREPSMDATFGQIAYRYNEIETNFSGINTALNGTQFQNKSFVAPILGAGKDAVCPNKPENISFGPLKITWDTPAAASDGDLPTKYVVYEFNNAADASTNQNNGSKILDIVVGNELSLTQAQIDNKFFVVTSLDKNNNEAGDFCNTPLADIVTTQCSLNSLVPPTAINNCATPVLGTTSTVFPINNTTVVTWTYDFGGGETLTQSQNIIFNTPSTEYVSSGWTSGTPDVNTRAIISDSYSTATGNIEACSCEVTATGDLTVLSDNFLKVESDIIVDGTLTVAHQGSVVQVADNGTVINNGTINVLQTTPTLASRDFMILGSPMTGETRGSVWSAAFLVLDHNTTNFVPHPDVEAQFPGAENFADDNNDFWSAYAGAGTVDAARGYLVRPQAGLGQPGGIFNYTYDDGTLNTGDINFTVVQNTPGPLPADNKNASPNVLANPYPSAIFADDFINANSMVDEVYFWEHLTPPSTGLPGAGAMNFSMEDISMYNLSGGVGAGNPEVIATRPNGYISTGQGFGIKATAAGTATFTNAMRRTTNNNTLRGQNDKDRVWISVENSQYEMGGATLLAFNENATAGIDSGYDSRRLATVVSLYTHLEDGSEQLGIQTREAFGTGVKVPVGFSTQLDAILDYKISIATIEGENLDGATVYLIDNYTNTVTNLSQEAYAFSSEKGTFHNRFMLQFEGEVVLGTNENTIESVSVFPNPTTGIVNIRSDQNPILAVNVSDLRGRQIKYASVNERRSFALNISELEAGMYFVTISTENGTLTKRIIKR